MTIAELGRLIKSKERIAKREAKEKATYDYILADLVGRSVARLYGSGNRLPQIYEVYPSLFDEDEINTQIQEQKAELSALRFKQFANSFNQKFRKEGNQQQ